jgi:tetratricopeptide (TPR) repeat protein
VDLLNKAVARDPNFFVAYCQLAFAHDLIGDTPARALAKSAIDSAFRLRPDSGEAHLALAWHLYGGHLYGDYSTDYSTDYDRARAELAIAQQSLPNNAQVYELAGSMDRSQRRWADAIHNLERACELDPRNLPYLINLGSTYFWLHDYDEWAKIMDRIVAVNPGGRPGWIFRARVELERRADTRPFRAAIEKILTTEPGSEKDPFVAGQRYTLALYDRDWDVAGRAAALLSQKNSLPWFPQLGRDFWVGVVARLKGDETSARASFMRARAQQEEELRVHPDDAVLLADLGLIDAGLGRKEEALSEGQRAIELASSIKDLDTEPYVELCFAIICAWTGERELALGQLLEALSKTPGALTYGNLRLSPLWDPLRGDPRFEKIVTSLAPKEAARSK